jgi:hypothetical protein
LILYSAGFAGGTAHIGRQTSNAKGKSLLFMAPPPKLHIAGELRMPDFIVPGKREVRITTQLASPGSLYGQAERRSKPVATAGGTALSMAVSTRFRLRGFRGPEWESFLRCSALVAEKSFCLWVRDGDAAIEEFVFACHVPTAKTLNVGSMP